MSTNDIINWLSGLRAEPSHQVARFDGLFFARARTTERHTTITARDTSNGNWCYCFMQIFSYLITEGKNPRIHLQLSVAAVVKAIEGTANANRPAAVGKRSERLWMQRLERLRFSHTESINFFLRKTRKTAQQYKYISFAQMKCACSHAWRHHHFKKNVKIFLPFRFNNISIFNDFFHCCRGCCCCCCCWYLCDLMSRRPKWWRQSWVLNLKNGETMSKTISFW